jgi:hypothetical protein
VSDSGDDKHLVKHLDPDGNLQIAPSWESLIDRQVREAMADGKFEDLPHHGRPLPRGENPYAGDKALAFDMLQNAGAAPPWIEADKAVRELLTRRDAIVARASAGAAPTSFARRKWRTELRQMVLDANVAIARVNAEAPLSSLHRLALMSMTNSLASTRRAAARHSDRTAGNKGKFGRGERI